MTNVLEKYADFIVKKQTDYHIKERSVSKMMILGHVGIQNYYNKVSSASTRSALEKIAERLLARQPQNYNQPNVDMVELSSSAKEYARMNGV